MASEGVAVLQITGRDLLETSELAMQFQYGFWTARGDAATTVLNPAASGHHRDATHCWLPHDADPVRHGARRQSHYDEGAPHAARGTGVGSEGWARTLYPSRRHAGRHRACNPL